MKRIIFLVAIIVASSCGIYAQDKNSNDGERQEGGWLPSISIEYNFLPTDDGEDVFSFGMNFGANYFFMHKDKGLFAGARIGYNSTSNNFHTSNYTNGKYYRLSVENSTTFISLPINIGYAITNNKGNFGVTPYTGLDFNFCVSSKLKTTENNNPTVKTDLDKKTAVGFRLGLQFRIFFFNVGGSYILPLNDSQKGYFNKDGYFAINIACGF